MYPFEGQWHQNIYVASGCKLGGEAVRQGNLLRRQNISSAIPPRQPVSFVRAEHRLPRRVRPTRCFLLLPVRFAFQNTRGLVEVRFSGFRSAASLFAIFFGLERPGLFLPSVGGRGRREPAPHQPRGLNPAREDSPACVLGMHRNLPQRSRALPAASRKELSGRDCSSSSLQPRTPQHSEVSGVCRVV